MATARHVARVHAGGGGAPPAATERHGGGGSVTPARTAARPPGTARPRPGRGGGRPSPRGGQTERGRWGGAARPSGPRGRRRGVLRRALSRALAAPGDARRSGVREGGGRRAPRLGAPPGVCSALARAGRAPSRQGRGKPLGRPGSCPRPPRPAPAGRPHPAGGAGGGGSMGGTTAPQRRGEEAVLGGGSAAGRHGETELRRASPPVRPQPGRQRREPQAAGTGRGARRGAEEGRGGGPGVGAEPLDPQRRHTPLAGQGGAPLRSGARRGSRWGRGGNPRRAPRPRSRPLRRGAPRGCVGAAGRRLPSGSRPGLRAGGSAAL